jgi:PAS domain S-box-containing protein
MLVPQPFPPGPFGPPTEGASHARVGAGAPLRVLWVGADVPASARLLEGLTARQMGGLDVRRARTLDDALAFLAHLHPDVVLLELGEGSTRALGRVDRFLEALPELPLVVLTSQDQEWLGVAAVQHGAQDFIVRTTTEPAQLARALRYAVERRQLLGQLAGTLVEARAGEMRVRRLLESALEGLVVLDEQRRVTLSNRAAARLLGMRRSELTGAKWDVIWNAVARPLEDARPTTDVALEHDGIGAPGVLATEVREFEVFTGGREVPLGMRITRMEWDGRAGWLISLTDLSDRKTAQRIALAEGVQRQFLPERTSLVVGTLDLAASNDLCEDVSGDFYDMVTLADGRIAVALGDVTGHGVAAALLMAQGRASLRAHLAHVPSAAGALNALNGALGTESDGKFLSLFCALICPRTGEVEWASAGHEPALLVRARTGEVQRLEATGPPLWILKDPAYRAGRPITLEPGDLLLAHSDGATDAPDPRAERYGRDRLVASLRGLGGLGAAELVERLRTTLHTWTGSRRLHDDLTLLAVRRQVGNGRGPARPPASP